MSIHVNGKMKLKNILLSLATVAALAGMNSQAWSQVKPAPDSGKAAADSAAITAAVQAPTPPTDSATPQLSDSAKADLLANSPLGRALFTGATALINGGPTCISCHNVTAAGLPEGGMLAKDVTHVYGRLGEAGLPAILTSTPFPAMASAYKSKPLTPEEVVQLTAFFQDVEMTAPKAEPTPKYTMLLIGGGLGLTVWMGLIFGIYFNRKKESVKKAIYDRQKH